MRTLREGSKGLQVIEVQQHLVRHGFTVPVDGAYGPRTARAVEQFQMANLLQIDGEVGGATLRALRVTASVGPTVDALEAERVALRDRVAKQLPTDARPELRATLLDAISFLGAKEAPGGSNGGPEIAALVDGYRDYWKLPAGPGLPWCAMAVSSWIRRGLTATKGSEAPWSATPMGQFYGGVGQYHTWAKKTGRFSIVPRMGSIFLMTRTGSGSDPAETPTAGHTGLVIDSGPGRILTIEGNTGNAVDSCERPLTSVYGYVEWWRPGPG